jgi:uroporphyrinogen-III synthase
MEKKPLAGRVIAVFESRRGSEMAGLVLKQGGEPLSAPALEEVPLEDQAAARDFAEVLFADGCDVLLLLTGVGTRRLVDAMALAHDRDDLVGVLGRVTLACRGPKAAAALKALGLAAKVVAPEPNTSAALLEAIDQKLSLAGKRVYVQEYGERNEALLEGLASRGAATVVPVPIYGYAVPKDTSALEAAIGRLADGEVDAALFTSQAQVTNLFAVAARVGREAALRDALRTRTVIASVGPVTTEALERHGLAADFEPEHPKMGHLVVGLARGIEALAAKKPKKAQPS